VTPHQTTVSGHTPVRLQPMCTGAWVSLLARYINGEIPEEERNTVDSHLIACRYCRDRVSKELHTAYRNDEDTPSEREGGN